MKKIAITLLLTVVLLCMPASVLANSFGVSPSSAELEVPKDGSATQDFTIYGTDGTVIIGLEDIPLTMSPTSVDVTDGETITVTFYGDGTNNTYEGKITFLASIGEQVSAGIKVRLTVHVNCSTEIVAPPTGGGGGIGGRDTKPPRIYDVSLYGIDETAADICWTTNEKSTSQVEYWSSPSKFSPLDETYVTFHSVTLMDLALGTTYEYKVMSEDKASNLAVSDEYSFTTLGEKPTEPEPAIPEPEEPVLPEPTEPEVVEPEEEPTLPEEEEPEVVEPEEEPYMPPEKPKPGTPWPLIGGVVGGLAAAGGIGYWLWRRRR